MTQAIDKYLDEVKRLRELLVEAEESLGSGRASMAGKSQRLEKALRCAIAWLSLISGPSEFYDAVGERSKEAAAGKALAEIEKIVGEE